jgi:hypothetical protein
MQANRIDFGDIPIEEITSCVHKQGIDYIIGGEAKISGQQTQSLIAEMAAGANSGEDSCGESLFCRILCDGRV